MSSSIKKVSKEVEEKKEKAQIHLRLPFALHEKLKEEAWKNRMSLNEYLLAIVNKRKEYPLEIFARRKNGVTLDKN